MPWRIYAIKQKYTKKDGTVSIYELKNKKWINCNKPYKPQKRGLEKPSLYSTRFGLLDLYNRMEQQTVKCPSGYTIGQCFNIMRKMWYAYRKAFHDDKDLDKMKKYAKAIQSVQKDLGIKTTSFPHIGIYGDELILNNKQGERIVFEDHSALKKKQEAYEKWQAENAKKIQAKVLKPDIKKGEAIVSLADESFRKKRFVENEDSEGYLIPDVLHADEEAGEERITFADDIPFEDQIR